MCLIAIAVNAGPDLPLVVAANRDEFHHRPTAAAAWWADAPGVLAGRDLEGGGTWLGVTTDGRFAALTNVREPGRNRADAPSRGLLVSRYLCGALGPAAYLEQATESADRYNGFNLVVGDRNGLYYLSNRAGGPQPLGPGIHGLSNHLLDTPWPKVLRTRRRLSELVESGAPHQDALLAVLDDRRRAPDEDLPATGVPLEWERILSAPCIVSERYGTRSSTALVIRLDGTVRFTEQSRAPDGRVTGTVDLEFELER